VKPRKKHFVGWKTWLVITALAAAMLIFTFRIHSFLAVKTQRVDANVLVVEGWIWDYGMHAAAEEFKGGNYSFIATSGLRISNEPKPGSSNDISVASLAQDSLRSYGVPADQIIVCPADKTSWNRTSSSARAVREKLQLQGIALKGINVLTIGPHARQSWLAYRHIMGPEIPVGIITVPTQNFDPNRWWLSRGGIYAITKDSIGWLREWLFGRNS